MACSQCVGIEREFDERWVKREAKRIRRRGPSKTTRWLIEAIRREDLDGAELLDVGGGVGSIQFGLLEAGAASVTSVDASTAYVNASREEARRRGVLARITYVRGDFVDVADRLDQADIVTLDRVICCYHDVNGLVRASTGKTRRLYGLVYPRDVWWNRVGIRFANAYFKFRRSPMRTFVHSQTLVESLVAAAGLERIERRVTLFWQVVLFRRVEIGRR